MRGIYGQRHPKRRTKPQAHRAPDLIRGPDGRRATRSTGPPLKTETTSPTCPPHTLTDHRPTSRAGPAPDRGTARRPNGDAIHPSPPNEGRASNRRRKSAGPRAGPALAQRGCRSAHRAGLGWQMAVLSDFLEARYQDPTGLGTRGGILGPQRLTFRPPISVCPAIRKETPLRKQRYVRRKDKESSALQPTPI
jgi:hypothetical protein